MSKKTVYNISRANARDINEYDDNVDGHVWISITEPDSPHIENPELDSIPNLKLKFWDIEAPCAIIGESGTLYAEPITPEQADELYKFIMEHKDKNIIVNCRMGISRSGAVARFCVDFLGHEWDKQSKANAVPNAYLYRQLVNRYSKDHLINDAWT